MTDSQTSTSCRPLVFLLMLVGLSACAGTSSVSTVFPPVTGAQTEPQNPTPREEDSQQENTPYDAPPEVGIQNDAEFYLQAADQAEGRERNALLLRAAEVAHLQGEAEKALDIMASIDIAPLPAEQRQRALLILAELGQFADRPLTLLTELPAPSDQKNPDLAARMLAARAQAHLALGQTLDAINALVQQERYIKQPQALQAHREHIWRTLRSAPPLDSSPRELASFTRATQGWAALADIMLDLWLTPQELEQAIRDWERNFSRHPANQIVLAKEMAPTATSMPNQPGRLQVPSSGDKAFNTIALMLPLSGNYAKPAAAVRDGFMTAYYRRPEPRPEVLVFDTGNPNDSIERLAEQAIMAGADIIIGPLSKDNVSRLAQGIETPIPTLALNYLENVSSENSHFYQFGLSPEDEAAQVADRALADGRLNALALAPNTDWGRRTLQAFQQRLQSRGGQLLDYELFDPDKADYRAPLTRLLRFQGKGKEATIRSDMDYIFLAAQPQQARLIRPQLRFYRATYVPVYATSHIYAGRINQRQDQDLNGIRFGDMPWILDTGEDLRDARELAAKLWPESYAQLPRLYALGFDAYALATQIAKNNLKLGYGYPAASGILTLQPGGRVSRGLVWAHFSNGLAKPIGTNPPSETPVEQEPEEGFLPDADPEEGYLPEEFAQ